jgi:hypothetical protein
MGIDGENTFSQLIQTGSQFEKDGYSDPNTSIGIGGGADFGGDGTAVERFILPQK